MGRPSPPRSAACHAPPRARSRRTPPRSRTTTSAPKPEAEALAPARRRPRSSSAGWQGPPPPAAARAGAPGHQRLHRPRGDAAAPCPRHPECTAATRCPSGSTSRMGTQSAVPMPTQSPAARVQSASASPCCGRRAPVRLAHRRLQHPVPVHLLHRVRARPAPRPPPRPAAGGSPPPARARLPPRSRRLSEAYGPSDTPPARGGEAMGHGQQSGASGRAESDRTWEMGWSTPRGASGNPTPWVPNNFLTKSV